MKRRLLLVLGAAALLAGCTDTGTSVDKGAVLEGRLFTAMNHDDFGSLPGIIGDMADLREEQPDNLRNTFLLGSANFWWLAEAGRPGANSLEIIASTIAPIIQTFGEVINNDPNDRVAAMVFLGAFLADAGFDRAGGTKLVEDAAQLSPQTSFQRLFVRRNLTLDDPETEVGVEAGFQFFESCLGAKLDRNNPDMTGKVQMPAPDSFCWGSSRVPHGFEGAWMIMGDMLVKTGRFDAARRAYLNAKLSPNYATWRYKDFLEQRLVADFAARRATYLNRDPTTWAPIGLVPYSCTQCHASLEK